jgi:hypothetical protein
VRQALPTACLVLFALYMELREAEYVGQTAGAPCAPQLGIAGVELSMVLAAQRSGSARTASSGPATLPSPRQADHFAYLSFLYGR